MFFGNAQAQSLEGRGTLGDIRPLEIGDTIPEELWNRPLNVINHPDGKNRMVLKDHKSKVIIIDFWSTYCGACIEGFPKLIELQKKYGDKILFLPVTYQEENDIKNAITTNTYFKGLQNPIVVGDSILHKYFKHLTIPHVVWIDPIGKIQGFTTAHHVISGHIDELLSGTKSHWATKIEDAELLNSPLVSVNGNDLGIKVISVHPTQYSFVKGFQPGLPLYNIAVNQNKEEGTKMVRYANHAIFSLYMRALNRFPNPVYESLLVFENIDPKVVKYYPNTD
ncbi:MAG: TlpA family protein disulfide reductase, partial [Sphingobacterium sp.]